MWCFLLYSTMNLCEIFYVLHYEFTWSFLCTPLWIYVKFSVYSIMNLCGFLYSATSLCEVFCVLQYESLDLPFFFSQFYRAVLIIPDIYNRDHVKKLTDLLLNGLGFSGCFVLQVRVLLLLQTFITAIFITN